MKKIVVILHQYQKSVHQNLKILSREKPKMTKEDLIELIRLLKAQHSSSDFPSAIQKFYPFGFRKYPFEHFLETLRLGFRFYNWDFLPLSTTNSVRTYSQDQSDRALSNYQAMMNALFCGFNLIFEDTESPLHIVFVILEFLSQFIYGRDDICQLVIEHVDPKYQLIKNLKQIIQESFSSSVIEEVLGNLIIKEQYNEVDIEKEMTSSSAPESLLIKHDYLQFSVGLQAVDVLRQLCLPVAEAPWISI